jgi:serine/threonine-protein kinase RsbW
VSDPRDGRPELRARGGGSDGRGVNPALGIDAATSHTWLWSLPFQADSVPLARRLVAEALSSRRAGPDVTADALAVVSELLANALRHARPLAGGEMELRLVVDDSSVLLAVSDGGAVTVPSIVSPAPMARSGRGLGIVHTLTRDWGVRETPDGNTVFGILGRA